MSLINTRSCNEASTLPLKLVLRRDSVVLSSQIGHRRLLSECWLESSLLCFSSSFYASVPGRPWKMAQVVRPLLCILGRQGLSTSLLALAQALMLEPFGEQKKWWTCSYQWMITLPFQLLTLKLSFYILKKMSNLFIWKTEQGRYRRSEIFHSLIHCSNSCNNLIRGRQNRGAFQISHMVVGTQALGPSYAVFWGIPTGNWVRVCIGEIGISILMWIYRMLVLQPVAYPPEPQHQSLLLALSPLLTSNHSPYSLQYPLAHLQLG